jgi:hypothetical protein
MASTDGDAEAFERLVTALRKLEIARSKDVAWDRSPAVRVIDCVLSLYRGYDRFVVPRLDGFEKQRPDVRSVHDLRTLIESFASPHAFIKQELRYDDVARARTLYEVVKWLDGLPALEAWAKEARPSDLTPTGTP